MMQPINLSSGEDPIADRDLCGALAIGGQMIQGDHCLPRPVFRILSACRRRSASLAGRWLAYVGIDFTLSVAHVLASLLRCSTQVRNLGNGSTKQLDLD
jgi:hypothetical protein